MKIINPVTVNREETSPWIRIGQEYIVLEVVATLGRKTTIRILGDDESSLWDSQMFVTVSTNIPSNWRAEIDEQGALSLAPESWLRAGFWEDYYDGKPEAIEQYQKEKAVIMAEA